jgi:hypothetical protein
MKIQLSTSSLSDGRWYEYLIRFALSAAATLLTGLISSALGASISSEMKFVASREAPDPIGT